jgi:hypothetical protein
VTRVTNAKGQWVGGHCTENILNPQVSQRARHFTRVAINHILLPGADPSNISLSRIGNNAVSFRHPQPYELSNTTCIFTHSRFAQHPLVANSMAAALQTALDEHAELFCTDEPSLEVIIETLFTIDEGYLDPFTNVTMDEEHYFLTVIEVPVGKRVATIVLLFVNMTEEKKETRLRVGRGASSVASFPHQCLLHRLRRRNPFTQRRFLQCIAV